MRFRIRNSTFLALTPINNILIPSHLELARLFLFGLVEGAILSAHRSIGVRLYFSILFGERLDGGRIEGNRIRRSFIRMSWSGMKTLCTFPFFSFLSLGTCLIISFTFMMVGCDAFNVMTRECIPTLTFIL